MLGLSYEAIGLKSDAEREQLFSNNQPDYVPPKHKIVYDFSPYMERQLKKDGVTKLQVWREYYEKNPDGLKSSQLSNLYRKWGKKVNPVMHMNHKASDKLFIDYAGKTLEIVLK